ncbi:ATPase [Actinophytocola xinjiangensis]|uniref:ATPase n=1 Tax=Actinophytocola xinjiangensis TaxID=485602 RepID=A0A7Z1AX07_9PSEU|nr:YHS domain-containing protein [Actinophytocola xinjiangensis]OLF08479.1 ATPase [Actinophytocola xinjiangensis]
MMTVEVFTNRALPHKHELAERLLHDLVGEGGAPDSVVANARELTHVLVHDPVTWATGGSDGTRYLVRLTIPGSWSSNKFGEYAVPRISEIIASFEDDPERLSREPHCVVHVVDLREHNLGTLGRVTTGSDVTRMITDEYRSSGQRDEAPEGSVIDPVCGMTIELAKAPFTLTHDGRTYGFCASVCRKVFAEDRGITV